MKSVQDILDLRHRLWRNGYRPVQINNGEKFPYQKEWPQKARLNPPDACRRVDHYATGTGILTDGLRAIDIDIEDHRKVYQIEDYCLTRFGEAPTRYRDNSPRRLLVYRASDGEPRKASTKNKITKEGVEVLGTGNQFFAYGTHPSGAEIKWRTSPEDVTRDDLNAITDHQCQELIAFCASLIDTDRITHRYLNEPMPVVERYGDEWFIGDIEAALNEIPNYGTDWEFWFRIACATFTACAGDIEGLRAFEQWSQKCRPPSDSAAKLWYGLHTSPPDHITPGTLWHYVRETNPDWERPSKSFTKLRFFQHKD